MLACMVGMAQNEKFNYQLEYAKGLYRGEQYQESIGMLSKLQKQSDTCTDAVLYLALCYDNIKETPQDLKYKLYLDSSFYWCEKYIGMHGMSYEAYKLRASINGLYASTEKNKEKAIKLRELVISDYNIWAAKIKDANAIKEHEILTVLIPKEQQKIDELKYKD